MKETKLLTKEILKKFKTVGNQNKEKDPLIICKLFYPDFSWTRYATEYDPKTRLFFWYVMGMYDERGYFSLDELLTTRWKLWCEIERDLWFDSCRFSELRQREGLE